MNELTAKDLKLLADVQAIIKNAWLIKKVANLSELYVYIGNGKYLQT